MFIYNIDGLVFTSELDKLNKGKKSKDDENMEDDEAEEGSSESVSSFEEDKQEGKKGKTGKKRKQSDEGDYPSELEDSDEEKEDYTIRKTDALIVAATAENDHSNLEIYVYDHKTSDLYVHHEIILASYPLCLEWIP